MLTEKTVALLRSLQLRLAAIMSKVGKRAAPVQEYPQPVVTVREVPVTNPEGGSVFVPSSRYAEYVRSVAASDRRYADVHYLSRR